MSEARTAKRICSLLPSATEIVSALGLTGRLVAVTHECDFPAEVAGLPRVTSSAIDHGGSTSSQIHNHISRAVHEGSSIYFLDQHLLERVAPDLILTQELCDVCAVSYRTVSRAVRKLEGPCQVLSLEPTSLVEIMDTIEQVGRVAGSQERAAGLCGQLRRRVEAVRQRCRNPGRRPRVLALEWLDPPFVGGHWVPEMVALAGAEDVLGRPGRPSRQVSWREIEDSQPDAVVLMPCGFDLHRTLDELARTPFPDSWGQLPAVREGRVFAVDGSSYFNRPGPRIVDGLELLAEVLQPSLFPRRKSASSAARVPLPHGP